MERNYQGCELETNEKTRLAQNTLGQSDVSCKSLRSLADDRRRSTLKTNDNSKDLNLKVGHLNLKKTSIYQAADTTYCSFSTVSSWEGYISRDASSMFAGSRFVRRRDVCPLFAIVVFWSYFCLGTLCRKVWISQTWMI